MKLIGGGGMSADETIQVTKLSRGVSGQDSGVPAIHPSGRCNCGRARKRLPGSQAWVCAGCDKPCSGCSCKGSKNGADDRRAKKNEY